MSVSARLRVIVVVHVAVVVGVSVSYVRVVMNVVVASGWLCVHVLARTRCRFPWPSDDHA